MCIYIYIYIQLRTVFVIGLMCFVCFFVINFDYDLPAPADRFPLEGQPPLFHCLVLFRYSKFDDDMCSKLFPSQEQNNFRSCCL